MINKLVTLITPLLSFPLPLTLALPYDVADHHLAHRAPDPPNFSYEMLNFTFHGGPASYTFSFLADGGYYYTNNDLSISIVDPSTFPALSMCNFYTPSSKALVLDSSNENVNPTDGTKGPLIDIGPPQPILAVSCAATGVNGMCLPVYATCEFYGPLGVTLGDCCSGYCAATKCRSTTPPRAD